jgi:hypothetical protein
VMLFVPGVKLKNQAARREQSIIQVAVTMLRQRVRPKQFRIPATTRPYVAHSYQRLRLDNQTHA